MDFIDEIEHNNDKYFLRKELDEWLSLDENKKTKLSIKKELEKKVPLFKKNKEYYRNLIFYSKSENVVDELDLEIIFCNNNTELIDIWKYFKVMSSSATTSDDGFGYLKMMLKDKNTNKYLGILEISCDIISCLERDNYIGWNKDNKSDRVKIDLDDKTKPRSAFLVNITCCIGLQPMSHNLNIGKLLVASVFSKDVLDYFYTIRGYYYAGVCTFGLYGKSIQYDRLKEIKYIGETKGTGTCEIPVDIYEKIRDFVKKYYEKEYLRRSKMSSSKMRILQFGLRQLDLNHNDVLTHGKKRGIYFGYTSLEGKDFFNGKKDTFSLNNNVRSFNDIVKWWKDRWSRKRYNHLFTNNRLKIAFELKDFTLKERKNEYSKQYQYEKFDDEIWLKNKKQKSIDYYYNHKDSILKELKINLENEYFDKQYIYPEYLCGFFDSDGSIYISKNVLFIGFTQCVLNILLIIQKEYGGTIFKRNKRNNNQRDQYTLRIVGLDCNKILNVLLQGSILKINKVEYAFEFMNMINKKTSEDKTNLINLIRSNTKIDDKTYFNRINWKYLSGMFDGDGCIAINYVDLEYNNLLSLKFSICQKYTPNFLTYIREFISNNINDKIGMDKQNIYTSKKDNIIKIYDNMKNYLIVKKFQYEKMIIMINEYYKKDRNFDLIKSYAYEIKNNKHQNIDYELDIDKNNIVNSMYHNIINKIEDIKEKEIIKETDTKILQSLKKLGANNPNYGKNLSDTHALNISLSTTTSKRAKNPNLSNDKIREIYALKITGIMQKDVAEKYNMNREMIRRIWNKIIMPTDDEEFMNKKEELIISKKSVKEDNELTFEQKTSIGKRSLSSNEYIEIIFWKDKKNNNELLNGKKIFSTTLSEYLSKLWNKKVTNDMIKNIWSGKTKLFEFDFNEESPISYDKYCELINDK